MIAIILQIPIEMTTYFIINKIINRKLAIIISFRTMLEKFKMKIRIWLNFLQFKTFVTRKSHILQSLMNK